MGSTVGMSVRIILFLLIKLSRGELCSDEVTFYIF